MFSAGVETSIGNLSLYVLTVLIWGSTWFAIEFQLGSVALEASIAYRYFIASGCLFLWLAIRKGRMRFPFAAHRWFAVMGLLIFCLNYLMAYRAQTYLPSALNAIVFSTIVWMNIFNARLFFGVRSNWRVIIGSCLGVVGLSIVFLPRVVTFNLSDIAIVGALLAALGAFSASLGNMVSQRLQSRSLPVLQTNAWSMLYGALATTSYGIVSGVQFTFDVSADYIISLLYLAIPGSVIAFGMYLTLLGRIGAHRVGYVSVLFPIVALSISAVFEGIELSVEVLSGTVLVLFGNILVLYRRPKSVMDKKPDLVVEKARTS